jgi:hypothetical protein
LQLPQASQRKNSPTNSPYVPAADRADHPVKGFVAEGRRELKRVRYFPDMRGGRKREVQRRLEQTIGTRIGTTPRQWNKTNGRIFSESANFVAGAGDAHDRNIGLIPEELICIPILEGLR